jgi:predicted transcriptional regulator
MNRTAAPLLRDMLRVTQEMTVRLDQLAFDASRTLACEVSRSAVVRAAVTAWLDGADHWQPSIVTQAIQAATQRSAAPLRRYPARWSAELATRLERFAHERKLSRSVVVRVAVVRWLDAALASPDIVTQAIRAALVRRGRKAKQ